MLENYRKHKRDLNFFIISNFENVIIYRALGSCCF